MSDPMSDPMSDLGGRSWGILWVMGIHHVLNRGVEKRNIFFDNQDRARFVHDMYEFNDTKPAKNTGRTMSDLGDRSLHRELLVDIHGWCLMGNHYHLLLSERKEGGLSKFAMKLNVGYAKYFNEKYKRSGFLFQGKTKKIPIRSQAHFQYILHYIHLNPLDLSKEYASWRNGSLRNAERARRHLERYRWSSYLDYCGKKNFPSILTTQLFSEMPREYARSLESYLRILETEPAVHPNLE